MQPNLTAPTTPLSEKGTQSNLPAPTCLMAHASREQAIKTLGLQKATALLAQMETFHRELPQIVSQLQTHSVKSTLIKLTRIAIKASLSWAKGNPREILAQARQSFSSTASQMFASLKIMGLGIKALTGLGLSSLMSATGPLDLGFDAIGAMFGMYNTVRIRKLEQHVIKVEQEHQQLVMLV